MPDVVATVVALLFVYWWCLWFASCVHENRLERRHLYDPPTGGSWARPRGVYEDLVH